MLVLLVPRRNYRWTEKIWGRTMTKRNYLHNLPTIFSVKRPLLKRELAERSPMSNQAMQGDTWHQIVPNLYQSYQSCQIVPKLPNCTKVVTKLPNLYQSCQICTSLSCWNCWNCHLSCSQLELSPGTMVWCTVAKCAAISSLRKTFYHRKVILWSICSGISIHPIQSNPIQSRHLGLVVPTCFKPFCSSPIHHQFITSTSPVHHQLIIS